MREQRLAIDPFVATYYVAFTCNDDEWA
jgi:hypothetical protein